ncbi:glycoside hydrolase family 24 [Denitrovibrio acetiphilus DSM 12809]|uniref:Lysozyme n=1 Tax=Denitrovibrio acetiphilus (strain DSM 12809 / NBRC 114555 / N2460) TaxID=522772 RepID=D4H7B1_DENA2|nr:glycoside hydrolase family protein [Denitrovibrio acetiphilus]ADD67910.1 glycoside hydrolase family 24 [Denitrovibrio acetiphilus DSM 12809]
MDEIIKRIKVYEGYSEKPYVCPAGKWTIGYGYNYEDRGFRTDEITEILRNGFSVGLAEKLLIRDVQECIRALGNIYPFFKKLDEVRHAVLADMVYQLGMNGFKEFRKMLYAVQQGDYGRASEEMRDSLWYGQSGRRSVINTTQMKTGEWEEII